MNQSSSASVPASDAELLNTIRSGDPGAYALLRERHAAPARRLAGQLVSGPGAADDVVASAFTQVLEAIRRGGGPTDAFRPYLLIVVRRAAISSVSGDDADIPTDEQLIFDPGQPFADPAGASPFRSALSDSGNRSRNNRTSRGDRLSSKRSFILQTLRPAANSAA